MLEWVTEVFNTIGEKRKDRSSVTFFQNANRVEAVMNIYSSRTCLWSGAHKPEEAHTEQVGTGELPHVTGSVLGDAGISTFTLMHCTQVGIAPWNVLKGFSSRRPCLVCLKGSNCSCVSWDRLNASPTGSYMSSFSHGDWATVYGACQYRQYSKFINKMLCAMACTSTW